MWKKVANAAERAFTDFALLDENLNMFKRSNERESRQSTQLTAVEKAKVMSYEDSVEAQAKRHAKEVAKKVRWFPWDAIGSVKILR